MIGFFSSQNIIDSRVADCLINMQLSLVIKTLEEMFVCVVYLTEKEPFLLLALECKLLVPLLKNIV